MSKEEKILKECRRLQPLLRTVLKELDEILSQAPEKPTKKGRKKTDFSDYDLMYAKKFG